jgi:hypothetical protein
MDLFAQKTVTGPAVDAFIDKLAPIVSELSKLDLPTKIAVLNSLRAALHEVSPFKSEPVDFVQWVPSDSVQANDYNPNSVAPPEMKLLEHSVAQDGYTQPIVAWTNGDAYEVVDGFHRNRVGKESQLVRQRVHGYLPVSTVNEGRLDRNDRIASTIRHNRARGKHKVEAMSDIVIELKRRNWTDEKIGRELGMDPDEVLRLTQITGLAEMFANQDFSQAWSIEGRDEGVGADIVSDIESEEAAPTGARILHTWEKWECFRAGFYEDRPPDGLSLDQGEERYREFLSDIDAFEKALQGITSTWKYSCEHYLTNERMNRIAWLGQASMAYSHGIPSCCRAGYHRLTDEQKYAADQMALTYLNRWLAANDRPQLMRADAVSKTEADLY